MVGLRSPGVFYELLKPGETYIGERYDFQLNRLAVKRKEKRFYIGHWR